MAFSGARNITDAFKLSPRVCARIKGPDVVEPSDAISSTKEIETIVPGDHGVVCTSRRDLSMWWTAIDRALDQSLPPVASLLQGVQVKRDKVVEEVAFDLASEYVDFRAEDVQSVTVSA